jgi:cell division control protein 45
MVHSPYVATTLKTWEEKGTKKLQRLYARMGVPLAACQQKYSHMTADYARQLEAKLEEYGREVGKQTN